MKHSLLINAGPSGCDLRNMYAVVDSISHRNDPLPDKLGAIVGEGCWLGKQSVVPDWGARR